MQWTWRRATHLLTLVFAGELVFSLPFHTARFFRPTLLDSFGLSNTQLGDIFAVYGITAFISYFAGGLVADRYSPRGLMTFSLASTALGGLYMATFPGVTGLAVLYGVWGVTTILFFWAALIRATRQLGGDDAQGTVFGVLDGGRGLLAAIVALLAVMVLASWLPEASEQIDDASRRAAFRKVIWFYSGATLLAAVLSWRLLPRGTDGARIPAARLHGLAEVLRRPVVWAQAGVIICAYCAFKGLDNFSLYGVQVMGLDEVRAAELTAWASWTRPLACIAAGLLADRLRVSRVLLGTFAVSGASFAVLALLGQPQLLPIIVYANALVCFMAAFALRGVYFALLEETRTPPRLTGTTVGIISFVGFTPEIFFGPVTGRILDSAPGIAGHQVYFAFLALVALVGVLVTGTLAWLNRMKKH